MSAAIEVVSFDRFLHGTASDRESVAKEIYNAFSNVGWVYLKDTGISQERVNEMFALAKTFFELPETVKKTWALKDPALNQGYTADGAEGNVGTDHKECYEHRRFGGNPLCPDDTMLPGFHKRMDEFYEECLSLSLAVLRCLALAMDLGDGFFDAMTRHADPQLRLLHYPSVAQRLVEKEGHARIRPHTDFGLCTLLFQDNVGGLEVDPLHTGDFKPAVPREGTVLVNIADLLQRLTNGRVRSTRHRVVTPSRSTAAATAETAAATATTTEHGEVMLPDRYSIPFFVHPDPETWIEPIVKSAGETKKWEGINAGEWRTMKTATNYRLPLPTKMAVTTN